MVVTDRGNFTGLYPPVFYYVQGFFVGADVATSVMLMRAFNAALFIGLFAAIYFLVSSGLRRAILGGALLTAVPLGMFLVPSINPSGWGLLAAATLFVSVLGYLTATERPRRIALGALAALALLIGAGARADAAIFAVVAITAAMILAAQWNARDARRLAYPAVLAVAAVLSFFSAGQSSFADPDASNQSFSLGRLLRAALDVPALWIGGMGAPPPKRDFGTGWPWGLGWLDTSMPGVVWVGMWGVYASVLFIALAGAKQRQALAVGAVALASILIPTYIQYLSDTPVGGVSSPVMSYRYSSSWRRRPWYGLTARPSALRMVSDGLSLLSCHSQTPRRCLPTSGVTSRATTEPAGTWIGTPSGGGRFPSHRWRRLDGGLAGIRRRRGGC